MATLGLRRRVVQYYEKGERDGKEIEIPLTVRLACYALENGITDFDSAKPSMISGKGSQPLAKPLRAILIRLGLYSAALAVALGMGQEIGTTQTAITRRVFGKILLVIAFSKIQALEFRW